MLMPQWTQTFCDGCASEGHVYGGHPGYFDGVPGESDGWAVAKRKYMAGGMTLRSGYVIEPYETTETAYFCPDCLADDEQVENAMWRYEPDRWEGGKLVEARKRIQAKEEAEDDRRWREDIVVQWLDLNGAPHHPSGAWAVDRYEDECVEARRVGILTLERA